MDGPAIREQCTWLYSRLVVEVTPPPRRYTDASWDCARVTGTVLQQPARTFTPELVFTRLSHPENGSGIRSDRFAPLQLSNGDQGASGHQYLSRRKAGHRTRRLLHTGGCAHWAEREGLNWIGTSKRASQSQLPVFGNTDISADAIRPWTPTLSERSDQPCPMARCLSGDLRPRNNNHRESSTSKLISGYSYQFTDRIVPKCG